MARINFGGAAVASSNPLLSRSNEFSYGITGSAAFVPLPENCTTDSTRVLDEVSTSDFFPQCRDSLDIPRETELFDDRLKILCNPCDFVSTTFHDI